MSAGRIIDDEDLIRPDAEEVVQDQALPEAHLPTIPVRVDGPVTVQRLPAVASTMRTITLSTTPEILSGRDPRRQRIYLFAHADLLLGLTSGDVSAGGSGYLVAANTSVELRSQDAIYGAAETGNAAVSVIIERWAD